MHVIIADFITCTLSGVYSGYYGGNSHVFACVRVCVCTRTSVATCIISKMFGTCLWFLYETKCPNKLLKWNEMKWKCVTRPRWVNWRVYLEGILTCDSYSFFSDFCVSVIVLSLKRRLKWSLISIGSIRYFLIDQKEITTSDIIVILE